MEMHEALQYALDKRVLDFWSMTGSLARQRTDPRSVVPFSGHAGEVFQALGWHWGTIDDLMKAYSILWDLEIAGFVRETALDNYDWGFGLTPKGRAVIVNHRAESEPVAA